MGSPIRHNLFYRRQFGPAVKAALLAHEHGLLFDDLRHTYVSLLISKGAHMKVSAELVGHRTTAATDRYGHLQNDVRDPTDDMLDAVWTGGAAKADAAPGLRVVD